MTFLLVTPDAAAAIAAINAAYPDDARELSPVTTTDGRSVLPANLLTDCHPGHTWDDYQSVLNILTQVTLTLADFPSPTVIVPAEANE